MIHTFSWRLFLDFQMVLSVCIQYTFVALLGFSPGSMGLHLPSHSAPPQPAVGEEVEGQEEDLEVLPAHQEVWLFPNGSTTWLPVTLISPTTSCGATNTGRQLRGWLLIAKVGLYQRAWLHAFSSELGREISFFNKKNHIL